MLEPTKAEIARRKKVAARSALADAVSRSSSEKKVEPTRADFGLPPDFDFEEFDAFLKKRERRSLAVKLIIFAILAAAFVFALHDDSEERSFGNERATPLAFPRKDRSRDPHKKRHPCGGAKPPDVLRARPVRQRASGNERGKSACVLAQERRALRSAKRGTERVLQKLPLNLELLLIVTQMGRDFRPGPRSG